MYDLNSSIYCWGMAPRHASPPKSTFTIITKFASLFRPLWRALPPNLSQFQRSGTMGGGKRSQINTCKNWITLVVSPILPQTQLRRLETAGIHTMGQLADLDPTQKISKLNAQVLKRLAQQARLQKASSPPISIKFEVIPPSPEHPRQGSNAASPI